ncbi:hypothetical protein H1R20_g321, partial [Candolleomyces eurysporus]
MRLPIELIDGILDYLSDDPVSLSNCSVSSYAFTSTSQRKLFASVKITPPRCHDHASLTRKLYQTLKESPRLSAYVHTLQLEDVGQIVTCKNGVTHHWLALDEDFPLLLTTLPAVRKLIWNNGLNWFNWFALPCTTRQAIQTAFVQWPLAHLEVMGMVNFPLSSIKTTKPLRHVELRAVHFVEEIRPGSSDDCSAMVKPLLEGCTPKLKSLSLVEPCRRLLPELATWFAEDMDVSGLQSLSFKTYGGYYPKGEDVVSMLRILQASASSITTLEVSPALEGTDITTIPSLALPPLEYPNLHALSLGFEVSDLPLYTGDASGNSSAQWVARSLENLANSPSQSLKTIQLRCHLVQADPAATFDQDIWKSLAKHMCSPKLGQLREVEIQIHAVYSEAKAAMPAVSNLLRDVMLKPFGERGISLQIEEIS